MSFINKEDLEFRILKHMIESADAINKIQKYNITTDHFSTADDDTNVCYTKQIFKIIISYFEESDGLLLTKNVLENKLVDKNVSSKHKTKFFLNWIKINSQEYNENDIYEMIIQLKKNYSLTVWKNMFKNAADNIENSGIEKSVDDIQDDINLIKNEIYFIQNTSETLELTKDGIDYFEKEYIKRKANPQLYEGIKCGLKNIDEKTHGWMPGQLIVVLAPSSGGKSIQLLNWGLYANQICKKNVLYISFEMDIWLCALRHVSLHNRLSYDKLKSLSYSNEEIKLLLSKTKELYSSENPYFDYEVSIDDPTPEYIEIKIRELIQTKGKPDIVIVDYIGNMTTRGSRKDAKTWEKNGDASVRLWELARKYEIPIISAQQINRETIRENRKTKESGKAVQMMQDAASGDQRLMHYAYYVIGMEPDKENSTTVYHAVKMRDAWFKPFCARVDIEHNGIYELTEDEQIEYFKIRGITREEKFNKSNVITEDNNSIDLDDSEKITTEDLILREEDIFMNP